MAGAYDLADLISFAGRFGPGGNPATGQADIGFHMGVVTAWNSSTGQNTLMVSGGVVNDIPVLSTADSIMLNVGDTVGLLRFKSTYFILGRIAPPGGGAALRMRSAKASSDVQTTSSSYVNLAGGPALTDVYIGTSRRCLVFVKASMQVAGDAAMANIEVSGASAIAPDPAAPAFIGSGNSTQAVSASAMSMILLTAEDGLNEGLNTFTVKYAVLNGVATGFFRDRALVVWPF